MEKEKGLEECFFIRSTHDDVAAIRAYLDIGDYRELNLFSYSNKKDTISIDEVSDEQGWEKVRNDLILNTGSLAIPNIIVSDISRSGDLTLQHLHDGRDLDLEYAERVVEKIKKIWPQEVKFFTIIEEESWEI